MQITVFNEYKDSHSCQLPTQCTFEVLCNVLFIKMILPSVRFILHCFVACTVHLLFIFTGEFNTIGYVKTVSQMLTQTNTVITFTPACFVCLIFVASVPNMQAQQTI